MCWRRVDRSAAHDSGYLWQIHGERCSDWLSNTVPSVVPCIAPAQVARNTRFHMASYLSFWTRFGARPFNNKEEKGHPLFLIKKFMSVLFLP